MSARDARGRSGASSLFCCFAFCGVVGKVKAETRRGGSKRLMSDSAIIQTASALLLRYHQM